MGAPAPNCFPQAGGNQISVAVKVIFDLTLKGEGVKTTTK